MEALSLSVALVLVAVTLAVVAERYMRHQYQREAQRHAWRIQLQQARGVAFKADELEALKQRVQKLELKGLTR